MVIKACFWRAWPAGLKECGAALFLAPPAPLLVKLVHYGIWIDIIFVKYFGIFLGFVAVAKTNAAKMGHQRWNRKTETFIFLAMAKSLKLPYLFVYSSTFCHENLSTSSYCTVPRRVCFLLIAFICTRLYAPRLPFLALGEYRTGFSVGKISLLQNNFEFRLWMTLQFKRMCLEDSQTIN